MIATSMDARTSTGRLNRLLATLPAALHEAWGKDLALREIKKGQSLDLKGPHRLVYFPMSCIIAIHASDAADRRIFMRFVGPSFAAGLVNMIATDDMVFDGVVSGSGYAMTVPAEVVMRSIDARSLVGETRSTAMARATKGALVIARCFGSHTNKQRLARLLLQARDCFGDDTAVTLTHRSFAEMLMVRRERATEILDEWCRDGVVALGRGKIHIRCVDELERASCGCYSWIQRSYLDEIDLWKSIRWNAVPSQ